LRQNDKAVADFSRAIELDPRHAEALAGRGVLYAELGQHEKAVADLSRFLELNPRNAAIWYWRGVCSSGLGRWDQAAADFGRALALDPNNPVYRDSKALAECSGALARNPRDWDALLKRSGCHRRMGAWDKALADLAQVHELKPDLAAAWDDHARLLVSCPDDRLRDPARAVTLARKAVDLAGGERAYWKTLGIAQYRAGDWKGAVAALDKAMPPGGDGVAGFCLAMAHWRLGEREAARRRYDAAVAGAATQSQDEEYQRFRDEARALLGLPRLVELGLIPYLKEGNWAVHVISVALSRDGRHVLAGGDGNDLRLYEVETGKEIRRFLGHTHWVYAVALSPDGRQALSGGEEKTLRLWDVETGKELGQLAGHTAAIRFVAFSPDGRQALSGADEPAIRLWDVAARKEVRQLAGHTGKIQHAVFSPDGRQVLSAGADETSRLWDVETGKEVRRFEDPGPSTCVCFSPDGRKALSAGPPETALRLWDVATGKLLRRLEGGKDKKEPPHWVVFTPDGRHAVSAHHMDGKLRLWEVDTGQELDAAQVPPPLRVNRVVISGDGRFAASANWRGSVSVWRLTGAFEK
jgi:tetratricopeptide (TPR) repeat protein